MKKMSTKLIVLLLAVALLFGCGVGGTIAWLVTQTDTVVNTFTIGNINIELNETDADKTFKMIPGKVYLKDPVVTVKGGSEDCYLFVKIEETCEVIKIGEKEYSFSDFINYQLDNNVWKTVDGVANVYYTTVMSQTTDKAIPVLKNIYTGTDSGDYANGSIIIKDTVTKEMMDAVSTKVPTLSFTAYAVQKEGLSVEQAWEQAGIASNYPTPLASGS